VVTTALKRFTDDELQLQVTMYTKIWVVRHPSLNFWGVWTPTTSTVTAPLIMHPISYGPLSNVGLTFSHIGVYVDQLA